MLPYGYALRNADALRDALKNCSGAGRPGHVRRHDGPCAGAGAAAWRPGSFGPHAVSISIARPAASYVPEIGTYTLSGSGVINTSSPYAFNFKYAALSGDFTLTARLLKQGGSADSARAGVRATEALSSTPNYAWTARYSSTTEIRAAVNGNNKSAVSGFTTSNLPVWVRVQRRGSAVYSAASTDGVNWTEKTNLSVTATTLYVGLALSSGNNAATVTADFDNVSIVGGGR